MSDLVVTLSVAQLKELIAESVAEVLETHTAEPIPELVSGADLARMLGVSRATVYRLRQNGMPSIRLLDTFRFRPSECLAWLQSNSKGGTE